MAATRTRDDRQGTAGSAEPASRRKPGTFGSIAAAVIGIAILVFVARNLARPFMRWPSGLQGIAICFLLALSAALLYPLIRDRDLDRVILRRLSGKWRFTARGAIAVFFTALILLLGYAPSWRNDSGEARSLPIASVNGMGVGDLPPAPRRVTLRGPLEEEEAVAVWWSPEGAPGWSGPIPASSGRMGWEATFELAKAATYRVLAMPSLTLPSRCRTCVPLRLTVADVDAAIDSITFDGLMATLTGKVMNPGGEYDPHLLRSDSPSGAGGWEDVARIHPNAGVWRAAAELRAPYHYPNRVMLRVAGLHSAGDGRTVSLAEHPAAVPAPVLTIRKINGREPVGGACAVQPSSRVTVEGTAAYLLDSERIWLRQEDFDSRTQSLAARSVAAKRIGPSDWSAEVGIGAGREFHFEAAISESDPGRLSAVFTSAAVRCFSTPRP